jgi:hypothetical protein
VFVGAMPFLFVVTLALVAMLLPRMVDAGILRCAHEGFDIFGHTSRKGLMALFDRGGSDVDNNDKPYVLTESVALYDNAKVISPCDVMFVNMPATMLLMNEQASLKILQNAYASLLTQDGEKKKDIVIILSGAVDIKAEQSLRKLLAEAWILLEKPVFVSDNVEEECNIRIITMSKNNDSNTAKNTVKEILTQLHSASGGGVDSTEFIETVQLKTVTTSGVGIPLSGAYQGYDTCERAKINALMWAQDVAQSSAAQLQKEEMAGEFRGFMENLIEKAKDMYNDKVGCADNNVSPFLKRRGLDEVANQIFAMLLPFYRRHVQLARVESAKAFNAKAGDDLAITGEIMSDLKRIRDDTINRFKTSCGELVPSGAPASTWNYDFDIKQLQMSLEEYLDSREAQAKLVGVLPRGRKPFDVSVHYFASHPLGKDYRQDALSLAESDRVKFDEGLAKTEINSVNPSQARARLQDTIKSGPLSIFQRIKAKRESSFAREMLMFPLSIKNPDVPLSAGRAKKQSSIETARAERMNNLGPERFIDWSVDSFMAEAKESLDSTVAQKEAMTEDRQQKLKNTLLNTAPIFKKGYYKHPSVNYESENR